MKPRSETFTVTLTADRTLNSNRRLDSHRRVRPVRTKEIREAFRTAATGTPQLGLPVVVVWQLTFGRRHRRDSPNWAPTAKAAIDGLVEAGVIADDSDTNITETHILAHDVDPALRADKARNIPARAILTITITETT